MKLYFSPGACSLASHIVLRELAIPFEIERVDTKKKKTEKGDDYNMISDKGYVPLLKLDNGQYISEGSVIMQYLADQKPEAKLFPAHGTMERIRVQEWLNYITSELHKAHTPLFYPELKGVASEFYSERIYKAYDYLSKKLEGHDFLTGSQFTIADAYLFTVLTWAGYVGLKIDQWPRLIGYRTKIAQRPSVVAAMAAEGLNKKV